MKIRKICFPIFSVALLSLTSCAWDSVSRAQAVQLLNDIISSRGDNFSIPNNNPISLTYKKAYYEEGKVNKIQEEYTYFITPLFITKPTVYVKHRVGEGLTTTFYKEEVHYVKNNIYYSRSKIQEEDNVWSCNETTTDVNSTFLMIHTNIFADLVNLISKHDQPETFSSYIQTLDDIYNPLEVTFNETYRSTSYGSLNTDIKVFKTLLDGNKELYYKIAFDYHDNLFQSLTYENANKTTLTIKIDYNSFTNILVEDLVCEHDMNENPDNPPLEETL